MERLILTLTAHGNFLSDNVCVIGSALSCRRLIGGAPIALAGYRVVAVSCQAFIS